MKEIEQSFRELQQMLITRETEIKRLKQEREQERIQNANQGATTQQTLQRQSQCIDKYSEIIEKMAEKHAADLEDKVCLKAPLCQFKSLTNFLFIESSQKTWLMLRTLEAWNQRLQRRQRLRDSET